MKVIDEYKEKLETRTDHHMGYPYNLNFDYGPLEGLQKFMINNLGDPFIESNYGVHSREFEIGVLQWFARLWEIDIDEFWGYVTNCGTEGNLHGILVGRECLPDGVLYSSRETHYSVFKAARMYRMDAVKVDTLETGELDYDHFRKCITENKHRPAIVNVNIGTTVKGAVDDLDRVIDILKECGFDEDRFYIHCDGALFGMMVGKKQLTSSSCNSSLHAYWWCTVPFRSACSYSGVSLLCNADSVRQAGAHGLIQKAHRLRLCVGAQVCGRPRPLRRGHDPLAPHPRRFLRRRVSQQP